MKWVVDFYVLVSLLSLKDLSRHKTLRHRHKHRHTHRHTNQSKLKDLLGTVSKKILRHSTGARGCNFYNKLGQFICFERYRAIFSFYLGLSKSLLVFLVQFHSIQGYLGLFWSFSGYHEQYVAFWLSLVISGNLGQSLAILSNFWLSLIISGNLGLSLSQSCKKTGKTNQSGLFLPLYEQF